MFHFTSFSGHEVVLNRYYEVISYLHRVHFPKFTFHSANTAQ